MSFFGVEPFVVLPDEGTSFQVLGEAVKLLLSGQQSNGSFAVLSQTSQPRGGTPLHTHHNEDEALYVVEGEYEILYGDRTVRATPGSFVFAPRGIPHQLTNVSAGPSIVLGVVSPAGFEGFFEEVSALPPPPDLEVVVAVAAKYGMEVHGT